MYEVFKVLQETAEKIGNIREVNVYEDNQFFGNSIHIFGVSDVGCEFALELTVKPKTKEAANG